MDQLTHKHPRELRLHKLRSHSPKPDKQAPEWAAHSDSVAASGVLQPLLITAAGQIIDGVWRWEAAKDWQLESVPCLVVADELAAVIIVETLLARKQMTRGAAVYLVLTHAGHYAESAEWRRLQNLKKGKKTNESPNQSNFDSEKGVQAFCQRLGVSWETLARAREVFNLLNDPKLAELKELFATARLAPPGPVELKQLQSELCEEFEPKLLNGEMNLWNVRSAIAGRLTTKGLPKRQGSTHTQLELFGEHLNALVKLSVDRRSLRPAMRELVATITDEEELDRLRAYGEELLLAVNEREQHKEKAA